MSIAKSTKTKLPRILGPLTLPGGKKIQPMVQEAADNEVQVVFINNRNI